MHGRQGFATVAGRSIQSLDAKMNVPARLSPFRWRTSVRRYLPWFLIDLGVAAKGTDCQASGGDHEWYNQDDSNSACYHCEVVRLGQLWEAAPDVRD
jgi:hypothetical protein